MPWFPRDFLAATIGWRLLDRALYRCLLDAQWELGALPHDEEELARIAGATKSEFDAAWPRVKAKFRSNAEGLLQNDRLEEHRQKALQIRDDKRRAGKAGGHASGKSRSRREADDEPEVKQKPHSATRSAEANGQAKPKPPSPSPSPSEDIHTHNARARDDGHEQFERLKALYPKFAGRQDWLMAEHSAQLRVEQGASWDELEQAVLRYAAYVAAGGVGSTAYVLTPAKFFSAADDPWKQSWELPTAIPRAAARTTWVPPDDEVANAS